MGDERSPNIRDRDRELLLPIANTPDDEQLSPKPLSSAISFSQHAGRETFSKVLRSWASKNVILLPLAITFYITWWFIHFVDGFFSPIYAQLGINIFGLGFVTSVTVIFVVGIFMSSWLGASVLSLGEWFIKRMPFEVAIIKHPRVGEYAFGFITSSVVLQSYSGEEELYSVYVPTNHLYIGDIFLVNSKDIIRPNLSVREGIGLLMVKGDPGYKKSFRGF
ncbi:Protein of unknown function DUF502 [Cynara cardunculus var. scolymus]|uniref:Uncharacterized protein n=1 Tax=Cynara cardunculus var. scolymus TaxID=59895 RepID=A0A118JVL2_CYNCS|nr:Protein of unknown function DUF502 [Cynara cardunculus var. scolymus]